MRKVVLCAAIFFSLILTLVSCSKAESTGETPCVSSVFLIEELDEQDAYHTVLQEGTLYVMEAETNSIAKYTDADEREVLLQFSETEHPVDFYLKPNQNLCVILYEGEEKYSKSEYSSDGKLLYSEDFVFEREEQDDIQNDTNKEYTIFNNQLIMREEDREWTYNLADLAIDSSEIMCHQMENGDVIYFGLYHADHSFEVVRLTVGDLWMSAQTDSALSPSREDGVSEEEADAIEDLREELVIALTSDIDVKGSLVRFNKTNEAYKISIKRFSSDQETAMQTAITTDKNIDLISISGIWDYLTYGSKHYLSDLTDLIADSGTISLQDYPKNVIEPFSMEGEIYSIPTGMRLSTLLAPAQYVEGKESWTPDEFLSFMEGYPDALSIDSVDGTKEKILKTCLRFSLDEFVDFESGVPDFSGENFQNMLMRIQSLDIHPSAKTVEERIRDGEVVLWDMYEISGCRDFANAESIYGEEVTIIGYPVTGGAHEGGTLIGFSGIVGISALSENKEVAFSFVEQYLDSAGQEKRTSFPTRLDDLEEYLKLEMGDDFEEYTRDGCLYRAITPDQVSKVRKACETASFYTSREMDILDIVIEEVRYYFHQDKNLQDACDIIDERVRILLNE